eukprot:gene12015-20282_t
MSNPVGTNKSIKSGEGCGGERGVEEVARNWVRRGKNNKKEELKYD